MNHVFLQKAVKEINVADVAAVDTEGQEELGDLEEINVPDVVKEKIEEIEEYNEPEWRKNPVLMAQWREKIIDHVDNRIMIDRKRRYRQSGF